MKIVHIGINHRADDVRILYKECKTLAEAGHEVVFITSKHEGTKIPTIANVTVIETELSQMLYSRVKHPVKYFTEELPNNRKIYSQILNTCLKEMADIYHVHEYSLLDLGIKIKENTGAKIVYDIHDDTAAQRVGAALGKNHFYRLIKEIEGKIVRFKEFDYAKKYDLLIAATPHLSDIFHSVNKNICTICNYPTINHSQLEETSHHNRNSDHVCYIGSIFKAKGINEIIAAVGRTHYKLYLAGNINYTYKTQLEMIDGWSQVEALGYIDRDGVEKIIRKSFAGLVTLLPVGNTVEALPVKMFEYMNFGIPVIASNFATYKSIIEKYECGICVDPQNVQEIADAIKYLATHRDLATQMGENGHRAVAESLNWTIEGNKLIQIYQSLREVP